MDRQELLMKFYEGSQERLIRWQAERATVTQIIVAVVAALSAAIFSRTSTEGTYQYLGGIIISVGAIGFVFIQKYHERIQYHRRNMEKLIEEIGDTKIVDISMEAEREISRKYYFWHIFSIYEIYSTMMLLIILYGVIIVVFIQHGSMSKS